MNDDEEEGYFEDLYKDFLDSLAGKGDKDFDRDDLIEIYDYANDTADYYTAFMALTQAVSRYPDDVEIAERLAVYFYFHDGDAALCRQLERLPRNSFIRRLLEIAITRTITLKETGRRLSRLIKACKPHSLNDEDIIRLCDVLTDLSMSQWAFDNYELLKLLAEYPDTLMNEIAKFKADTTNRQQRLRVLNDFTSEFPFNVQAWLLLAEFYSTDMPDPEQAENAANYALAIDPSNFEARTRQFDARFDRGATTEELTELLDRLQADFPEKEEEIKVQRSMVYQYRGMTDLAVAAARDALKTHPRSIVLYDRLITMTADKSLDAELNGVFSTMTFDEYQDLFGRMESHISDNEIAAAGTIAALLSTRTETASDSRNVMVLETLYRSKRYDEAIDFYSRLVPGADDNRVQLQLICMLSLKKTGRIEELKKIADNLDIPENLATDSDSHDEFLKTIGTLFFVGNLVRSLTDPTVPETEYDPYAAMAD